MSTVVAHFKGGPADGRRMVVHDLHHIKVPTRPLLPTYVAEPFGSPDPSPSFIVAEYESTFRWTLDSGEHHAIYEFVD